MWPTVLRVAAWAVLLVSTVALLTGAACSSTDDAGKAAGKAAGAGDDVPLVPPGPVIGGELDTAAQRADSALDARLASLSREDAEIVADAVCEGVDAYYTGVDWEDFAEQFGSLQYEIASLGDELAEILATSESDREAFLRSSCAIPTP